LVVVPTFDRVVVPRTAKCSRVLISIFKRLVETGAKEVSKR
jgi:hypothetical protein